MHASSRRFMHKWTSGTGASCIYALLGASIHPNWSFLATEIDPTSRQHALANVQRNQLSERIILYAPTDAQDLLGTLLSDHHLYPQNSHPFHFCMCNPPFYASSEEIALRRATKRTLSSTEFDYSESESVYFQGELGFISRLIEDSVRFGGAILWYSSLVGIKSNAILLGERLMSEPIAAPQVKIFTMNCGKTRRWIVAWSFVSFEQGRGEEEREGKRRRRMEQIDEMEKEERHADIKQNITIPKEAGKKSRRMLQVETSTNDQINWINTIFNRLEIERKEIEPGLWRCHCPRKTWGRRARRAELGMGGEEGLQMIGQHQQIDLVFLLQIKSSISRVCFQEDESSSDNDRWQHLVSLVEYLKRSC